MGDDPWMATGLVEGGFGAARLSETNRWRVGVADDLVRVGDVVGVLVALTGNPKRMNDHLHVPDRDVQVACHTSIRTPVRARPNRGR